MTISRRAALLVLAAALAAGRARPAAASCATNASVTGTIQAAVNLIPATLAGDYCLSVPNGSFGEAVTVRNINTNGFRIYISSAPGADPLVAPPGGTAAFNLENASVTLVGLRIQPSAAVPYGVVSASASVSVVGLRVNDAAGFIATAGIALSTGASVTDTLVNVLGVNARALWLVGAGASVLRSTAAANSTTRAAASFSGAAVSLGGLYAQNMSGAALELSGAGAQVSVATAVANSAASPALRVSGSSAVISGLLASNGAGTAVEISSAAGTLLARSTMTTGAASLPALSVDRASMTAVYDCSLQGSTAAVVSGSTGTSFLGTSFLAAGAGSGLALRGVSWGLSVTTAVFTGGRVGLYLDVGNRGLLTASSSVFKGHGNAGVHAAATPAQVWLSSNTLEPLPSAGADVFGIRMEGLASGATVQDNQVYFRAAGSMGSATAYAVQAKSFSGLLLRRNRVSVPGTVAAGSVVGVSLENTPSAIARDNDVFIEGGGLSSARAMQLIGASVGSTLRGNVLVLGQFAAGASTVTLLVDAGSAGGLQADYNDYFSTAAAVAVEYASIRYGFPAVFRRMTGLESNSISADPRWPSTAAGAEDFHPLSQGGRWDPGAQAFVADAATAFTVDRGSPAETEPAPDGSRANMGSYAGTSEASRSYNPMPAGCADGFNLRKGDGFPSLQAALDSMPRSPAAGFCVVLRDTATYSEAPVFDGFSQGAGQRITLMGDPSFVSSGPVIAVPGGMPAGLTIRTSSVTIERLTIRPAGGVVYGVWASSPSVALTSVTVDGLGQINTAGIRVSSNAVIAYSSVTVGDADALYLDGAGVRVSSSYAKAAVKPAFAALRLKTGTAAALGPLELRGHLNLVAGTLDIGRYRHLLGGDLTASGVGLIVAPQGSTVVFDGGNSVGPVVAHQQMTGPAGMSFGALEVQTTSVTFNQSFNAESLISKVAGSTVSFANGQSFNISELVIHGGAGTAGLATLRSKVDGSLFFLNNVVRSSVTATQVRDSWIAAPFVIHANDGRSINVSNNDRWNFLPFLATVFPGETFVSGVGKVGTPAAFAGQNRPVVVQAYDSSSNTVAYPTFSVSLVWDEPFVSTPPAQPLLAGATVFGGVALRTARTTIITPRAQGIPWVWGSTVAVVAGPADRLQALLMGEFAVAGSTGGKAGTPDIVAQGKPTQVAVRLTDAYWNLVASADQVSLTTSAPLASNLPQAAALQGGTTLFANVVFTSPAASVLLVAADVTAPAITAGAATAFSVFATQTSSPSVSFSVPAGSVRATIGGRIEGTASDPVAVARVSVAVQRKDDGLWYDWTAGTFAAASPAWGFAGVSPGPLPVVSWAIGLPDEKLAVSTGAYFAVARATNPTGNLSRGESTFTFTTAGLAAGSGLDGEGAAAVLPALAAGCQVSVATIVYTAGPRGLRAGGFVALRLPDGWGRPDTTTLVDPPALPGWVFVHPAGAAVELNPASKGAATLGDNWIVVSTTLPPGGVIEVKARVFQPSRPGPQRLAALSQGAAGGQLVPLAEAPAATRTAGVAAGLVFSPSEPLALGPLQAAPTMQARVVDSCGVEATLVSSAAVSLWAGGVSVDTTAVFLSSAGAPVSSVVVATGSAVSAPFRFLTSTAGVSFELLFASAALPGGAAAATRRVEVLGTTLAVAGLSVDTGTPTGAATATAAANVFQYPAFVSFSVPTGVSWEVVISSSPTFAPAVFRREGSGPPGRGLAWNGVDEVSSPARSVPPGVYFVRVSAGGGVAVSTGARIYLPSSAVASLYGSAGAAGAYARVHAAGPGAHYGSYAVASSTGFFQVFGLQAGGLYQVRVTTGMKVEGRLVELSTQAVAAAGAGGVDAGTFTLPTAGRLRVSVGLPAPAPREFWGGARAHSSDFSRSGAATLHYASSASASDDGRQSFAAAASTWSSIVLPPGTYALDIGLPEVRLSTRVEGLTVLPGADTDVSLTLARRAAVHGWAVLAGTSAATTVVSVSAAKAGEPAPGAFAAAAVPCRTCSAFVVDPTSAVFSLFGLDPGTWTLVARAPGHQTASTTVFVAGDADLGTAVSGGVDLRLSSHGALSGSVAVTGDTTGLTPYPTYTVYVDAYDPARLTRVGVPVALGKSVSQASGTFVLSGLPDGAYELSARLDGFVGGSARATVAGGSGTARLELTAQDAWSALTVILPGGPHPPSEFSKVALLRRAASSSTVSQDLTAGATVQYSASSATVRLGRLPPGRATFDAYYPPTGAFRSLSRLLTHGSTLQMTLDLSGSTFPVRGKVVFNGTLSFSSAAYSVSVSSLAGLLAQASTASYCLLGSTSAIRVPGFHVELLPVQARPGGAASYHAGPLSTAPASGSCVGPAPAAASDGPTELLAYVAAVGADGSFTFPGVSPGAYALRVSGDLDADPRNGRELPEPVKLIDVSSEAAGLVLRLDEGRTVSGELVLPPQGSSARSLKVVLRRSSGEEVRSAVVSLPNAGRAPFSLAGVPPGDYALEASDLGAPRQLVGQPRLVRVDAADVAGLELSLQSAGAIRGRLAVERLLPGTTREVVLITDANAQLLPPGLRVYAAASPWFIGGRVEAKRQGDALRLEDGQFVVEGLLPGTYDLLFEAHAQPAPPGTLALVSAVAPGLSVDGGVTDAGTVPLTAAVELRGRVFEAGTSTGLANVRVSARPSAAGTALVSEHSALTDRDGAYVLMGLSPQARYYDVTAGGRGEADPAGAVAPWQASAALGVDVASGAARDFALSPALFSIRGRVAAPAGGPLLSLPRGDSGARQPGARLFVQPAGVAARDNPLGDIEAFSAPDGVFEVPSLAPGTYRVTAASLGYASLTRLVSITTASVDVGTLLLAQGATLSGRLTKPDGSSPSLDEVSRVAAASADLTEVLFGRLSQDANTRSAREYSISGFRPGRAYQLVLLAADGGSRTPDEARRVVFSTTTESRTLDLVYRPARPSASARARRSGTGFQVIFDLSSPLRARTDSDDDLGVLLATVSARGALSEVELSASRTRLTAFYAPAVGESSFTLRLAGYSAVLDPDSNDRLSPEFFIVSTVTFFGGIDGLRRASVANFSGGAVSLEGDAGRLSLPSGAFGVDPSSSVEVTFQVSAESLARPQGLAAGSAAEAVEANLAALRFDPAAYPSDLLRAMAAAPPSVPPFSPFYDVLLPLGVRTALARPVPLTVAYSSGTDPAALNLYWYNEAANAYVLQQDVTGAAPVIDRVNRTITVNVNHFSTFVLFQAAAAVIGGNAFVGGDIEAFNFPNPFDLREKSVSAIHGGACQPSCTVRGTMIRFSLPLDASGDSSVRIFNVAGERVRTLDLGSLTGGRYYYHPWDGRNDAGRDVASGVYIGELRVGGRRTTFKMALIK